MTPTEIVEKLKSYVQGCNVAASQCEAQYVEAIREHAVVILSAVDLVTQLQGENDSLKTRLLRQACWFEQFEAASQPKSWPLLEDDDCDPGAAL